jgi:DNA-binding PucR family transcriptional regulator
LSSTLLSWLRQMGDRKAVAAELHVHPQTVSYRIGRLRELFGPALDQAEVRANLLLALAWGPATAAGRPSVPADGCPPPSAPRP